MDTYIHSTIAMLAVINPVVCGVMMMQISNADTKKKNITSGIKAMLIVLLLLLLASLAGKTILDAFGISMEAFKVVGGIILSFIGFQMLLGPRNASNKNDRQTGIMPLIMFAASPGTITMVITLSVAHDPNGLPISAMVGSTVAVVITIGIMTAMEFMSKEGKPKGQALFSSFMGVIIVAMGVQFMLDGIKAFFGI